jgi:hypothetical protein
MKKLLLTGPISMTALLSLAIAWVMVAQKRTGAVGASYVQVVGLLGYKLKRVSLQGGWRYLVIHQSPTTRSFVDLGMTGVSVGAVIPSFR